MFKKSGDSLHITRGDAGSLTLKYDGHTFIQTDVVVVNIYKDNAMNVAPIMSWVTNNASTTPDHPCEYTTDGDTVTMSILGAYTQLEDPITEKTQYWWEAVCGDVTFICYDENGPKILNLYPGGIN